MGWIAAVSRRDLDMTRLHTVTGDEGHSVFSLYVVH